MGMGANPDSCKDMDFTLPSDIASHVPQVNVWRTLRHEMETKGSVNLVTALYKARVTKPKDLRDKVFSILGLLSEEDRSAIHVDYSPLYTPQQTFNKWRNTALERKTQWLCSSMQELRRATQTYRAGSQTGLLKADTP